MFGSKTAARLLILVVQTIESELEEYSHQDTNGLNGTIQGLALVYPECISF